MDFQNDVFPSVEQMGHSRIGRTYHGSGHRTIVANHEGDDLHGPVRRFTPETHKVVTHATGGLIEDRWM